MSSLQNYYENKVVFYWKSCININTVSIQGQPFSSNKMIESTKILQNKIWCVLRVHQLTWRSVIMTSPPTSTQSLYYSDCVDVGGVAGLYFFRANNVPLYTLIFSKSTHPKLPWVYLLDNGSYSTIQSPKYPTYIMKIEVWPALFGIPFFLRQKFDPDYTPKFSPNL